MRASLSRSVALARQTSGTIRRSFYETLRGPYTSVVLTNGDGFPSTYRVTERLALSIASVYRALSIYGDLIGTMPVHAYRDTEKLPLPAFVERPAGQAVGWTDEIAQILWSLLLRGNAYLLVTDHYADGYPSAFRVLDPCIVTIEQTPAPRRLVYRIRENGTDTILVSPSPLELLHIRWQTSPGGLYGNGILDAQAAQGGTLSGAWAANYFAADLMSNPSPPSVLTHPMRLDATQAAALQTQWTESVARSRAIPAVLSGGITFQPVQLSARDAQLMEMRRWNATDIATMFGLPPYMLGGSTGDSLTYATIEGEMLRLWTTALMPMAVRLERAFSAWLPRPQRLRFVPDVLLRSQTLDRFQAHEIALRAGFETVDEVRDLENRPPLPAGVTVPDTPAELDAMEVPT